jgi:hypothetical protein
MIFAYLQDINAALTFFRGPEIGEKKEKLQAQKPCSPVLVCSEGCVCVCVCVCVVCVCVCCLCECACVCVPVQVYVCSRSILFIFLRADIRKLQQLSDGTCNAIPAWEITLNPQSAKNDPDCKAFPFYDELGLGDGASYGGGKVLRMHLPVPSLSRPPSPSLFLSMSSSLSLALSLSRWLSRALSHTRTRSLTLSYLFSLSLSRS